MCVCVCVSVCVCVCERERGARERKYVLKREIKKKLQGGCHDEVA